MYILFESVRALGGLERVSKLRLFATLRQLLLLPENSSNYAYHLRLNYERYLLPIQDRLARVLDDTYRSANLFSPEHTWLHARIDVSKIPYLPTSSAKKRKATARRRQSETKSSDGTTSPIEPDNADPGSNIDESDEAPDFYRHPEATRAAIRARMNANAPELDERHHYLFNHRNLPLHRSPLPYLDLRNHIVRLWYRNPTRRLDVFSAVEQVPPTFHFLACRVFAYLESTGVINFGAISFRTSVAVRTSILGQESVRKHVAIVGAGIAGLISARQLRSFGISVTIFEARHSAGGRIRRAHDNFSAAIDMGAMIITGMIQNPISVLAEQTNAEIHHISSSCPLFDTDGQWVPAHADNWAEREFNAVLSATARYRNRQKSEKKANFMSLGVAFQKSLEKRVARRKERINRPPTYQPSADPPLSPLDDAAPNSTIPPPPPPTLPDDENILSDTEAPLGKRPRIPPTKENAMEIEPPSEEASMRSSRTTAVQRAEHTGNLKDPHISKNDIESNILISHPRDDQLISRLLRWHIANLEYACAGEIEKVSLKHWDQDDPYAFEGDHVLLKDGFEPFVVRLMEGLERNIEFNTEVVKIRRPEGRGRAEVETRSLRDTGSRKQQFDAVLVTVPLGVLKQGSIQFEPPLPEFKTRAIERLGTGGLMKVAMEFSHQFWLDTDMFGALRESVEKRGAFYFFWSFVRCTGKPILIGMVAEPAVQAMEELPDKEIVAEGMMVLRRRYPDAPDPVTFQVSRWSKDSTARGAYTNIPVGSSGEDYDLLAAPVNPNIYFAGEHTCRMYPTTCASGIISGLRESGRIAEKFGRVELMAQLYSTNIAEAFKPQASPQKTYKQEKEVKWPGSGAVSGVGSDVGSNVGVRRPSGTPPTPLTSGSETTPIPAPLARS